MEVNYNVMVDTNDHCLDVSSNILFEVCILVVKLLHRVPTYYYKYII